MQGKDEAQTVLLYLLQFYICNKLFCTVNFSGMFPSFFLFFFFVLLFCFLFFVQGYKCFICEWSYVMEEPSKQH